MIFIDGVGIGKKDYKFNPFFKNGFNTFTSLFGSLPSLDKKLLVGENKYLFGADANLGVNGLPQSGTGQASLFCGVNVPKSEGRHFGPFPLTSTVQLIKDKHLLTHYSKKNNGHCFANAYPKVFFNYLNSGKTLLGVTATCCRLNGFRFNKLSDLRQGTALTAEIINDRWNQNLNYNLPLIKPQTAARRLLRIATKHKFTLYEYYMLDHLGHLRIKDNFNQILNTLDLFLFTILTEYDKRKTTIIICSDHGNFEDLSIKMHTRNPALTITAGKFAEELFKSVKSISDIKPSLVKFCR
jgi:hypothetical protein